MLLWRLYLELLTLRSPVKMVSVLCIIWGGGGVWGSGGWPPDQGQMHRCFGFKYFSVLG